MMSVFTEHKNFAPGESYYEYKHPTGVSIYVYPRPESEGVYAMYGAKCGSVDDNFIPAEQTEAVTVPAGIAHFLEHKLFESEELGAFERYAKTGADANAFTSFDCTCYLFSCAANFEQSFEILLDFVQSPYFTEETVQKEQGIIGQEIRMYLDRPDNQLFFNMLKAMYINDHIRLDIAGTEESISHITADMLYTCYNAFYHPENMAICVAGNVTPEQVLKICDRQLKPSQMSNPTRLVPDEPENVGQSYVEERMDVAQPMYMIAFKDTPPKENVMRDQLLANIAFSAFIGEYTAFYEKLLSEKLINDSFGCDGMLRVRDAAGFAISGESPHYERIRDMVVAEIERVKREGLDPVEFECARRDTYGTLISELSSNSAMCRELMDAFMYGESLDGLADYVASLTIEDAQRFFNERIDTSRMVLSVVLPVEDK